MVTRCGKSAWCVKPCPHPSINYPLPFICKVKHHCIYKIVLPVEENMQIQPVFASVVSYSPGSSMTFCPACLSRDPHGIGWKDSLPNWKPSPSAQCARGYIEGMHNACKPSWHVIVCTNSNLKATVFPALSSQQSRKPDSTNPMQRGSFSVSCTRHTY